MASPVKVITIDSLDEKINELRDVRDKVSQVLQENYEGIEDMIRIKYIEMQSSAKVVEFLNNEGYRIKSNGKQGERKYISNDVTDIIISSCNTVDTLALHQLAKVLYNFNIGKAAWITVVRLCKNL
jgi:hypothetical protein